MNFSWYPSCFIWDLESPPPSSSWKAGHCGLHISVPQGPGRGWGKCFPVSHSLHLNRGDPIPARACPQPSATGRHNQLLSRSLLPSLPRDRNGQSQLWLEDCLPVTVREIWTFLSKLKDKALWGGSPLPFPPPASSWEGLQCQEVQQPWEGREWKPMPRTKEQKEKPGSLKTLLTAGSTWDCLPVDFLSFEKKAHPLPFT